MARSSVVFTVMVVAVVGLMLAVSLAPVPTAFGTQSGATGTLAPTTTTRPVPVRSGTQSSVVAVGIGGREAAAFFNPEVVTVVIGVNNTVVWTNGDTAIHTVTSVTQTASGAPLFNSGDMGMGAQFSYTFTAPGTYTYICIYHGDMVGKVVVEAQPPG